MSDFRAKDIGFRAQKKLLSRMSKKNVAKMFIDDVSANLLDNIHRMVKLSVPSKKEADKIVKNIIKVMLLELQFAKLII